MEMYGMTGERLGTIGQSENEEPTEWEQALSSKPSISVRKGYAAVSQSCVLNLLNF
jgi:hypothetical protein